ncbi:MAG: tetratricopeptide repeat protein [Anaerolineae bacterium]|nr:tetratricopeptide repeat protein [Anaerolineae bacterium]
MNRHFIRYVVVALFCLMAASLVHAQDAVANAKPTDAQAQKDYAQAQTAESAGNYDSAIKLYGEVIQTEPSFWQASFKRGEAYAVQENYKAAVEDYNQVIKLQPDYALVYVARAVAYEQLNDHTNAIADSNKAIELKASDDYVYFNRGLAYLGIKEFEKAITDFTYWINLNPKTYPVAYFYRSRAYYAVSNLKGALDDLDIFIELQPKSGTVLADRAYVKRLMGHYEDAISDYTKAIDLKPTGLDRLYYERGETYGLQGKYDKMIEDLRQYAKIAGSQTETAVLTLLKNHPE